MLWTIICATSLVVTLFGGPAEAVNNGLASTPQMGWNTWNSFGLRLSAGRNSTGHLQADTTKFPNGMAFIADKLHAMGLGFGIYSDVGSLTCGQYAGSLGNETIDAQTWASWGIDYLKYDNCYNEGQSGTPLITYNHYKVMAAALNVTGQPILYS